MADKDLNPGQQHYEDLFDNQGNIRDVEEQAANNWEQDYSNPNPIDDYNNSYGSNDSPIQNSRGQSILNQSEQAITSGNSSGRDISIGQRENNASHQTSGFDNNSSNPASKQRLSSFKKRLAGGLAALICSGGVFIAAFIVLSSPIQFVQIASVARDFVLNIVDDQRQARSSANSRSITKIFNQGDTMEERKMNNRVGLLGRLQAEHMTNSLAKKGVTFKTDGRGYSAGMDIDTAKYLGTDSPTREQIEQLAKKMDIGNKYSINGSTLTIADNLTYSEMKRTITTLDDPGKWSISSWLGTRATLKLSLIHI